MGKIIWWVLFTISLSLLLLPATKEKTQVDSLILCLDASASLSDQERSAMLKSAQKAFRSAKVLGEKVDILLFGEQVQRFSTLPPVISPQSKSDYTAVLATASAILQNRAGNKRIILYGDGIGLDETECHSPYPVYTWFPPERFDWKLEQAQVPKYIRQGMKIPWQIHYQGNFRGTISLTIKANGKPYWNGEISVKSDEIFRFQGNALLPGPVQWQITGQNDLRPENNCAFAYSEILPSHNVLLVSSNNESSLQKALIAQNIPITNVSEQFLPDLSPYPLVILADPSSELIKRNRLWRNYLSGGGSIIICTGKKLQASWLPMSFIEKEPEKPNQDSKEPDDLPLEKEKITAQVKIRSASIVFVIDRSRSMVGEKLDYARQAALASIEKLWAQDKIGVIGFDTDPVWYVHLGRGTDLKWIEKRLEQITPGGGTAIAPALHAAYAELIQTSTHIKHIILLSDGHDESGIYVRNDLVPLIQSMRKNDITITTIGIGDDYDLNLMPLIASWGRGQFYYAGKSGHIPQIVLRDVDRVLGIRKLPKNSDNKEPELPDLSITPPELPDQKPPTIDKKVIKVTKARSSLFLSSFEQFPGITKYSTYRSKTKAITELWVKDDPLLAHWSVERGKVMMWNSNSETWHNWQKYSLFWAATARFLLGEREKTPAFLVDYRQDKNVIDIISLSWDKKRNNEYHLESAKPIRRISNRKWQVDPGTFPAAQWQKFEAQAIYPGENPSKIYLDFALPFSQESADLKLNSAGLQALAKASTGGTWPRNHQKLFPQKNAPTTKSIAQKIAPWHSLLLWLTFLLGIIWIMIHKT